MNNAAGVKKVSISVSRREAPCKLRRVGLRGRVILAEAKVANARRSKAGIGYIGLRANRIRTERLSNQWWRDNHEAGRGRPTSDTDEGATAVVRGGRYAANGV